MAAINPMKTTYKGIHFKSLLEARWAVFFDTLSLRWKYEPRQYRLGYYPGYLQEQDAVQRGYYRYEQRPKYGFDGELLYTPDFALWDFDTFVEVKPNELTKTEEIKIVRLARQTGKDVLTLIGLDKFLMMYSFDIGHFAEIDSLEFLCPNPDLLETARRNAQLLGRPTLSAEFEGVDFE